MLNLTRSQIARHMSNMTNCYNAVTTGNRNGKPFAEIVTRPLDGKDCDRSGYVPVSKLSDHVFEHRTRIYRRIMDRDPHAGVFRELKNLHSKYYTFITTLRTEVDDNLYDTKRRVDYGDTNLLLRIQLLHVGRTSYSVSNELVHDDDRDHALARVVHHVTLVDPESRRPVAIPEDFLKRNECYALEEKLPYRVRLSEPTEVHRYSTVIRWSDTDAYKHLNTIVYTKYAVDAVYDAIQNGKLGSYTDSEGTFRVKDFLMRFAKESLQGQKMEMQLWEGPVGILNLRMEIDGEVVNESLMTSKDHSSVTKLSNL